MRETSSCCQLSDDLVKSNGWDVLIAEISLEDGAQVWLKKLAWLVLKAFKEACDLVVVWAIRQVLTESLFKPRNQCNCQNAVTHDVGSACGKADWELCLKTYAGDRLVRTWTCSNATVKTFEKPSSTAKRSLVPLTPVLKTSFKL